MIVAEKFLQKNWKAPFWAYFFILAKEPESVGDGSFSARFLNNVWSNKTTMHFWWNRQNFCISLSVCLPVCVWVCLPDELRENLLFDTWYVLWHSEWHIE